MGFLPLVARKRAWIQGARSEGDDGILDNMSGRLIPANENIFCVCARIIAVRQGRIDRSVLIAVRKVKPDAALRQKDRADAENVFVHGYNKRNAVDMPYCAPAVEIP